MVHISKNQVDERIRKKLLGDLEELFVANTSKHDFAKVLFELLSPTERIMLAKRVGIINALTQGYSSHTISHMFKVSTSTVFRVEDTIAKGKLPHIVKILKTKTGRQKFLKTLESFVTFGFPGMPQKRLREKIKRDAEHWRAGGI